MEKKLKTRIYIDGYNLYYGCLKRTNYKWLDIYRLFSDQILPSIFLEVDGVKVKHELDGLAVKFFTADIIESVASASDSLSCQATYHAALNKKYPNQIEIIKGFYSKNKIKMKKVVDGQSASESKEILVWKLEEKQSDVNLALNVLNDIVHHDIEQVVIVTNDSDIAPVISMVKEYTSAIVGVVLPTKSYPNTDLVEYADWYKREITAVELSNSQLPRVVNSGRRPKSKPISWYPNHKLLQQILHESKPVLRSNRNTFQWLEKPNEYFGKEAPIDFLETEEGCQKILRYMREYKKTVESKS